MPARLPDRPPLLALSLSPCYFVPAVLDVSDVSFPSSVENKYLVFVLLSRHCLFYIFQAGIETVLFRQLLLLFVPRIIAGSFAAAVHGATGGRGR